MGVLLNRLRNTFDEQGYCSSFKFSIFSPYLQLQEFRSLSYLPESAMADQCDDQRCHNCKLVDNFRPCMPLNDRLVTSTFLDNLSLSREEIAHVPDRENFL